MSMIVDLFSALVLSALAVWMLAKFGPMALSAGLGILEGMRGNQGRAPLTDAEPPLSQVAGSRGQRRERRFFNYRVRLGDMTLRVVAHRELGDWKRWDEIWDANRDAVPNPDLLVPGTVILIPAT